MGRWGREWAGGPVGRWAGIVDGCGVRYSLAEQSRAE